MTSRSGPLLGSASRAGSSGARAIFLIGFMGSGKSTAGLELSQRLGWGFQDLDERIEGRAGKSIAEIFRDSGEAAFREMECAELVRLVGESASAPTVAALGGGAFAQAESVALLEHSGGSTVFLETPLDEMWQRCQAEQKGRPLAQNRNQFRQLYKTRLPFYMKAGLRIQTAGKSAHEVAAEIALRLGLNEDSKE